LASFTLGKYPQTVVEDSATLTALATATDTDSDGYLEYGSDEYKKVTGAPDIPATSPLRVTSPSPRGRCITSKSSRSQWKVLSGQGTATGLVMSEKILTNSVYYTSTSNRTVSGSTVYANNYQYSTLRAMLNGLDGSAYSVGNFAGKGFLDVAFTEAEKAYITTTTVDNSAATTESSSNSYACANTSDRIFAFSWQDLINTSYGFNSSYSNLRHRPPRRPHRLREGHGRLDVHRFLLLRERLLVVALARCVHLLLREVRQLTTATLYYRLLRNVNGADNGVRPSFTVSIG
jgi:hypothetical protein